MSGGVHVRGDTCQGGCMSGGVHVRGGTWTSSRRAVMGVPVTTQAWRLHRLEVIWAATLLVAATS